MFYYTKVVIRNRNSKKDKTIQWLKRKRTNRKIKVDKILHRKLKIEQHEVY